MVNSFDADLRNGTSQSPTGASLERGFAHRDLCFGKNPANNSKRHKIGSIRIMEFVLTAHGSNLKRFCLLKTAFKDCYQNIKAVY